MRISHAKNKITLCIAFLTICFFSVILGVFSSITPKTVSAKSDDLNVTFNTYALEEHFARSSNYNENFTNTTFFQSMTGYLAGTVNNAQFTFSVKRKSNNIDNIRTNNLYQELVNENPVNGENFQRFSGIEGQIGKGRIWSAIYKGNNKIITDVGTESNFDLESGNAFKDKTLDLSALEYNVEYRAEFIFTFGGEWWIFIGNNWWQYHAKVTFTFKITPNEVKYNNGYTSTPITHNGIDYFSDDFAYTFSNNATTTFDGYNVKVQPTATMRVNGASYKSGTVISDEGKYSLLFSNALHELNTYQAILDKTAPTPIFNTVSNNNIYSNGTAVSYSYNAESEAPITVAKYSRRAITVNENCFTSGALVEQNVNFASGKVFNDSGIYTVTLTDLCGNSSTTEFCIVNQEPNYNYRRATTSGYFKTDNYKVKIPYLKTVSIPNIGKDGQTSTYAGDYVNAKTYVFSNYENAVRFMGEIELQECVSVISENTYRYKQRNNPNGTATYTSVAALWEVLEFYAKKYVNDYGDAALNSNVYIDNSIVIMGDDVLDIETKQGKFFIDDSFVFTQFSVALSTSKTYTYSSLRTIKITNDNGTLYDGLYQSGRKLSEYIGNNNGLLRITETDLWGNSYTWEAFYDTVAPVIVADYEYYSLYIDGNGDRQSEVLSDSVTISTGLEIDTNLKSFSITDIPDLYDKVVFAQITLPSGATIITRDIASLKFGVEGFYDKGGEYRIKVYDRSLNAFEYAFTIAGNTPKVSSYTNGTGENRTITISFANGSADSSITHFTIYRYGVALPENGIYQEYNDEELVNSVAISQDVWSYTFFKGGIYTIRFTDSFNRVTLSEAIIFTKGLPSYTLTGVSEGGKTRKAVSISFDNTVGYILTCDGAEVLGLGATVTDGYKIEIPASAEYNGKYEIKLYKKSDEQTYITFSFIMDTIPPVARVLKEDGTNLQWGSYINVPFKLDWDTSENVERVKFTLDNGYIRNYTKGTVLTENGKYVFTVTDDVGNSSTYEMELDTTVKYSITYSGNSYSENDVNYVKTGFTISEQENNLILTVLRDGVEILSRFGELYSTEGVYELVITDYIGNSVSVNIVIDKTAPNITIIKTGDEYEPVNVNLPVADIDTCKLKYNGKTVTKEIADLWEFSDWGEYQITVGDKLGNSTTETFTIKKRPPVISIYDINNVELENGATVNNGVFFVWNDENATGSVSVGGYAAKTYLQNTIITDEGVFTLTVTDAANNKVSVSVSIVKAIKFAFVVANGTTLETVKVGEFEKTREPFTLSCENLNVSVKKDGQAFAFIVGQQIAVDGVYEFHIYDDIGNSEDRTIVFDSTAPSLAFVQGTDLTENVTVTLDTADVKSVKVVFKSTETVTTEYFPEAEYIFSDWGTYTITATDHLGNFSTVSFEIKKVPPEVCFQTVSGRVLNNNDLSNEAFVLDYSEELVIKYYIDNNYSIIYKKGTILSEQGSYHFVITDLANNTSNYQVALDCDIKFSVIVDGQTVKNFNDTVVGKRYFELTLGEPLTVSYSFNGSDADSLTDTVVRFTDEGVYEFVLVDAAQNSITLYFEIDKTAPLCSIDTATLTKSDVVLTVDDLNDIASYKVQKDGVYVSKYILKKTNTFDDEGVYTISVQDYLANKRVIEFQIKRNINYKMSVADGFITNGKVSLSIKESNVRITAIKDGKEIELPNSTEFEFTEAGVYAITISDYIGNSRTVNFTLEATKFRKDFSYNIPLDSQIILTKNGKEIDVDDLIDGDILTVKEDGEYVLTLKKNGVYSTYSFVIDTVVPVLIINGQEVKAGEKIDVFKTDITLASSKKNSTMKVYYNGEEVVYKSTESLSAAGHYKVVITDEVGNVVEYEFDRAFTLNAGAIVLIVACVLTVVLVVFLIFRRRRKMKIM